MMTLRITKTQKDIIAWRVATDWLAFARRIISEGGKPVKFSDARRLDDSIHAHICKMFPNDERVCDISNRVQSQIAKLCKAEARRLIESRRHLGFWWDNE